MNSLVRTTITLPSDLYESLRLEAFYAKTSFSGIIKRKLGSKAGGAKKSDLLALAGKYNFGQKNPPKREEIYDSYLRNKMPARY